MIDTSFVELVKEMREAQKLYFRNRTQTDLIRSKNLERQVDAQIEKLSKAKEKAEQLSLGSNTYTQEFDEFTDADPGL